MKEEDKVTVRELYTLIDSVKKDVMGTVLRLENKFDTMEAGRLTRLEGRVSELFAQQASEQGSVKTTAFLIPVAIGVFFSVINIVLFFVKQ